MFFFNFKIGHQYLDPTVGNFWLRYIILQNYNIMLAYRLICFFLAIMGGEFSSVCKSSAEFVASLLIVFSYEWTFWVLPCKVPVSFVIIHFCVMKPNKLFIRNMRNSHAVVPEGPKINFLKVQLMAWLASGGWVLLGMLRRLSPPQAINFKIIYFKS